MSETTKRIKEIIKSLPIIGRVAKHLYWRLRSNRPQSSPFPGSVRYWETRYAIGGNSGVGSYGEFAQFKAGTINHFVVEFGVQSVIEFGCGDGNQLKLANYPAYIGYDISETAVTLCRKMFATDDSKAFYLTSEYRGERAELTLSLDVLYHLIEDEIFEDYIARLFSASERYVILYTSNCDDDGSHGRHIRHRKVTKFISDNLAMWKLKYHIPNKYPYKGDYKTGSFADFFVYEKSVPVA